MKLIAVAFLALGMLCNSVLAVAEDPVPFRAMMQSAGSQPSIPPRSDARANSTAALAKPAHDHMTRGGKTMLGVGIGMEAIGALVLGTTLAWGGGVKSGHLAAAYGTGAAFAGGGAVLIVCGVNRRTNK